jgi:hypothetical protein
MEISLPFPQDLVIDLSQIEFIPGDLTDNYKYEARVPRDIWNKWRPDKPLVRNDYRVVKFGRPGYQHYFDAIGDWEEYNHYDKKRRDNYRARHEPITININGKDLRSYLVPFTNEFFSYWFMW